jgi:hypothetical protein
MTRRRLIILRQPLINVNLRLRELLQGGSSCLPPLVLRWWLIRLWQPVDVRLPLGELLHGGTGSLPRRMRKVGLVIRWTPVEIYLGVNAEELRLGGTRGLTPLRRPHRLMGKGLPLKVRL